MGRRLAALLEREIESASGEREEVIARMATAARISASAVNQILRDEIKCPPLARLRGFARVLGATVDQIMTAAESDGCEFAMSFAALAQHTPQSGETKGAFLQRCVRAGNSHNECEMLWEESRMSTALQIERGDFRATPFADLPIVDEDFNPRNQSGSEIIAEILGDDNFDRLKRAHLLFAPGDDRGDPPDQVTAYKLPVARMVGGTLKAFRQKVSDAIGAINGARTPLAASDEAKRGAYNNAVKYLRKADVEAEAIPPLRLSLYGLAGESTETKETDVALFDKDIIRTGLYHHPVTERSIDVTTERMDRWIAAFKAMKENGVDVEAVVDHSAKAEDVIGYIQSLRREGEVLHAIHKMKGERGINLAKTVKNVSVLIDPDFRDGAGNNYGEAITHVAIVQSPVIAGQEAFVPLSRAGVEEQVPILRLQTKENDMDIKELRKILGAGDDLTEENALARIDERIKKLLEEKGEVDKELITIKGELESAKAIAASAKPKDDIKVDPDTLEDLVESREAQADSLVEGGNITPKVAASLKAALIGTPESRNVMMLSRKANGGVEPLAKVIFNILKENHVVELVEKTGPQVLAMSYAGAADQDAPDTDSVKAITQHVVMTGDNGQK